MRLLRVMIWPSGLSWINLLFFPGIIVDDDAVEVEVEVEVVDVDATFGRSIEEVEE